MSQSQHTQQFLDIFTYEKMELPKGGDNTVYINCTLLRPLDSFKIGDTVHSISMCINLYLWKDAHTQYYEEAIYTP